MTEPVVAFTGDTTSDFIVDNDNIDVLRARILVMEVGLLIFCLSLSISIVFVCLMALVLMGKCSSR